MSGHQIWKRVARDTQFRARRAGETARQYRDALIAHAEQRDFTAAHEVRVGRQQSAWTAQDVEAFHAHVRAIPPPRQEDPPPLIPTLDAGQVRAERMATEALATEALLEVADRGLQALVERRTEHPRQEIAIMVTVLLTDGRLLITSPGRGDRVAVVKALARQLPVFGFTVGHDAFIHKIEPGKAAKRDAIMMHIGTREVRLLKVRPYRYEDDRRRVVFEDPLPDVDVREQTGSEHTFDPYAGIFVSVPPTTGDPS